MKKTVNVEIAGVDFVLNADAYHLLEDYLNEMETIFSTLNETEEILEDIESRIAEELLSLKKKSNVITHPEVQRILSKIGSPDEIHEMLGEFDYDQKTTVKAKLYRDPDNRVIAGVCSGLGAYFDIDPVIVRIFFILFTLAWGIGLVIYFVLFLIIPKAETPLQKMQMHGGGGALRKIDQSLRKLSKRLQIPEMTEKIEASVSGKKKSKAK